MNHSLFFRLLRALAWLVACVAGAAGAMRGFAAGEESWAFAGPHEAGQLSFPPRNEASGLAASRRSDDVLWTHDDSGGADAIYAVSTSGEALATLRIKGVKNSDWEDIAAVDLDGQAWLVIGDIGDNDAKRKHLAVHFIEEPSRERLQAGPSLSAAPAATLRITFSDGARDCESLAIDAKERAIYLLSKRDLVPRLYRVALPAPPLKNADLVAEFVTVVPDLARPTGPNAFITGLLEKGRARPCGMDFAPDGSAAVVVTLADAVIFARKPGEMWGEAFARAPIRLPAHALPQAEAVCFSRNGAVIYVASEETRKLLRYDRK